MPRLPALSSVTAKQMARCAVVPEVMNCLLPLSTYLLPSSRARVLMAEASEPVWGSVSMKAPRNSALTSLRK